MILKYGMREFENEYLDRKRIPELAVYTIIMAESSTYQ